MLNLYFLSFLLIIPFVRASSQEPETAPTIFIFNQEQVELFEFITSKEKQSEATLQTIEKLAEYLEDRDNMERVEHVFNHPSSPSPTELFEVLVSQSLKSIVFSDKATSNLLGAAMIRQRRSLFPTKTLKFTEADRFSFSGFFYFLRASKKLALRPLEEVNPDWALCDAAYFYRLIILEDAIECYSNGVAKYNTATLGAFVGDMYFGELVQFQEKFLQGGNDAVVRAWVDQVRRDDTNGSQNEAASHMITAGIHLLRSRHTLVDHTLLLRFLDAMITIRLSNSLMTLHDTSSSIAQGLGSVCDLYKFLADNHIRDEYIFSGSIPLHAVAIAFRLNEDFSTARVGIINSGSGIQHHKSFVLTGYGTDEPEVDLHGTARYYAPFAIFERVPLSALKCGVFKDENDLYFKQLGLTRKPEGPPLWQFTRGQFAKTCYATSLWYSLYWLEQDKEQNLESLRHALILAILKPAIKEYMIQAESEVGAIVAGQEVDDHRLHPAFSVKPYLLHRMGPQGQMLSGKRYIRENTYAPLSISDKLALYISVSMNSAFTSLPLLVLQRLDMIPIMREYKALWEEMKDKPYWQPIKENAKDTYIAAHSKLLTSEPPIIPEKVAPKVPLEVQVVCAELDHAINANPEFTFTDAIRIALKEGYTHPMLLEKIAEGASKLHLEQHHMNIIADSLIRMAIKLAAKSPRLIPFDLLHKIFLEVNFPAIYVYNQPVDFETVPLDPTFIADDTELRQHAVNQHANIVKCQYIARYLLKLLKFAPDKRPLYVQKVMDELLALPQHLFAFHLGHLIAKDAILWQDLLPYKDHFAGLEDFERVLLDYAIEDTEKHQQFASIIEFKASYPSVDTTRVINPTTAFRMSGWSNPHPLRLHLYAAYLLVNGRGAYMK